MKLRQESDVSPGITVAFVLKSKWSQRRTGFEGGEQRTLVSCDWAGCSCRPTQFESIWLHLCAS